jgi:two-component system response regulator PilR (NtrC family)
MEAEFFGYRKGAFTGATEDRDGFFQAANGGTLLLDEVADLPLPMQVKLLRAIQERAVRKVGATSEEAVDVRIISATHQNLEECVAAKRFRQDLYYRLNVIELKLPALRNRRDDIPLLTDAILARLSDKPVTLSQQALDALENYDFPGNVRELENILERALAFANRGVIEVDDLALKIPKAMEQSGTQLEASQQPAVYQVNTGATSPVSSETLHAMALSPSEPIDLPKSLPAYIEQIERDMIVRALQKTRYNKTQAAELLGLSFRQLRYQIQKLKIDEAPEDSN